MTIPSTITTELTLQRPHGARIWQATLPNGRPVVAFRLQDEPPLDLRPGGKALASLSVCDFSQAHILQTCSDPSAQPHP